jgi:hypothetical protein
MSASTVPPAPFYNSFIQSMEDTQQKIYNRLAKIAKVLGDLKVDYAVIGGNAMIAWMEAKGMESRSTRDVDLMLRKKDFPRIRAALDKQGYEYIKSGSMSLFFDTKEGSERKVKNCIHLVYSGEKIKENTLPKLEYAEFKGMKVATIDNLVRMKVAAARLKDGEHLQDLINAGYTTKSKVMKLAEKMTLNDEQQTVLSLLKEKSLEIVDLPPAKGEKLKKSRKTRDEGR